MNRRFKNSHGFTLIETVMVLVVIAIISTIALRQFGNSIETAKHEQTKQELDALAKAIVGNADAFNSGARDGFGYVGDVGALPPNLDALVSNPGGFSTWRGPYVSRGDNQTAFKFDGWNTVYTYVDTLIRSTGSGSNIDKIFAVSRAALLANSVSGLVTDASRQPPSGNFVDSILVRLDYPDGSGGVTSASTGLGSGGKFSFTNIPVGNHTLRVIHIPESDTTSYSVSVYPGRDQNLNIIFPADLW